MCSFPGTSTIWKLDCVNKNVAGRTVKDWYVDNKEKLNECHKTYYVDNKEKIFEKRKDYYQDKIKQSSTSSGSAGLNTSPAFTPLALRAWMLRCTWVEASG